MGIDGWLWRIVFWIILVLSLSVHEWAHAWSAWKLGDDTASRQGRMTLNPMAHIDPIGTVLLPLLGVPFGWAKPVPVNPALFRRDVTMRTGMMITAVAGPVSNLFLAAIVTVLFVTVFALGIDFGPMHSGILQVLQTAIALNVILAFFNMLPVPPLDGSRVADGVMPNNLRPAWERFLRLGPMALLGVIILPRLLGFSLFNWPLQFVFGLIYDVVALVS